MFRKRNQLLTINFIGRANDAYLIKEFENYIVYLYSVMQGKLYQICCRRESYFIIRLLKIDFYFLDERAIP